MAFVSFENPEVIHHLEWRFISGFYQRLDANGRVIPGVAWLSDDCDPGIPTAGATWSDIKTAFH